METHPFIQLLDASELASAKRSRLPKRKWQQLEDLFGLFGDGRVVWLDCRVFVSEGQLEVEVVFRWSWNVEETRVFLTAVDLGSFSR